MIVFVSGPYRGTSKYYLINRLQRLRNILRAYRVSKELWSLGMIVFTPHLNSVWMDGCVHDDFFLNGCLEILLKCDCVLMLDGWDQSVGAKEELRTALTRNIPVYYTVFELIKGKSTLDRGLIF